MREAVFEIIRTREFDRKARKIWAAQDLGEVVGKLARYPEAGTHLGGGLYKVNEKDDLTSAEFKALRKFADNLRGVQ